MTSTLADRPPLLDPPEETRRSGIRRRFSGIRSPSSGRRAKPVATWVPASRGEQLISLILATISAVLLALIAILVVLSPLQHYSSQTSLYDRLRLSLAEGSTPIGPLTNIGEIVTPGTPIAVIEAAGMGLTRDHEVVVEGTAGAQTMLGIGHRRDTVLPCQLGAAVLMARAGSYGGVGALFAALPVGERFSVTTGQGECTYRITGQRRVGDVAPAALAADEGRMTITTAEGLPYMPTEVLRIDAELLTPGFDRPPVALASASLPAAEAAMGTDPSNLFTLVLLLQLLVAITAALAWMWRRWGKRQTWIVAVPLVGTVGVLVANAINQFLLPNLL